VDCILVTSGEPLDEIIENAGWMAFLAKRRLEQP